MSPVARGCCDLTLLRGKCSLSAQQGRATVDKVRAAGQELGDSAELVGIEPVQQRGGVFSYWVEHVLDVSNPLRHRVEDLLPPVVRVRFTNVGIRPAPAARLRR